jgi:hypothetical protein
MDMGSIGLKALELLSPVLLAALTWAAAKLAELIRAKVKNEYLRGVLVRLDDVVFTAVKDLQQRTVDEIKAAVADGKITEAEKERIKRQAIASVKSHLGVKGLSELAKVLGLEDDALDGLLSSKVEAAVHDIRRASKSANGSTSASALPLAPSPTT